MAPDMRAAGLSPGGIHAAARAARGRAWRRYSGDRQQGTSPPRRQARSRHQRARRVGPAASWCDSCRRRDQGHRARCGGGRAHRQILRHRGDVGHRRHRGRAPAPRQRQQPAQRHKARGTGAAALRHPGGSHQVRSGMLTEPVTPRAPDRASDSQTRRPADKPSRSCRCGHAALLPLPAQGQA
jgi:hypothetical protein